ncbi:MAG: DMT family transporter [Pseudomonadota bacterium]
MPPALWGLLTALGWGGADFVSRFTGGKLGVPVTLAGMMASSLFLLSLAAWHTGTVLVFPDEGWALLLGSACCLVLGTLLLYRGIVRGPISLVAPIVAAYPVWSLILAVTLGVQPSWLQWAAMLAVMGGVVAVARLGGGADAHASEAPGGLPVTIAIALAGSLCFALGLSGAQYSAPVFGEMQVLLTIRVLGASLAIGALILVPRLRRPVPLRWWPLLVLQGLLDGGAYLALLAGSETAESATASVVVASAFCVVPVVLAWIVLKERISAGQWLAIAVIVAGVAVLSAA